VAGERRGHGQAPRREKRGPWHVLRRSRALGSGATSRDSPNRDGSATSQLWSATCVTQLIVRAGLSVRAHIAHRAHAECTRGSASRSTAPTGSIGLASLEGLSPSPAIQRAQTATRRDVEGGPPGAAADQPLWYLSPSRGCCLRSPGCTSQAGSMGRRGVSRS